MEDLTKKHCVPCEGGVPAYSKEEAEKYLPNVPKWKPDTDYKVISREFNFDDFKKAMVFVNKVADLAEGEGHHPDILISYSRVTLALSTHALHGLSENDFILATKIDALEK